MARTVIPNSPLVVDSRAFRLWLVGVAGSLREMTPVHRAVSEAVLPIYQRSIPVYAGDPGRRRRPPVPGRLRASARAGATQRAALVRVGRGVEYARPITFGWPGHSIAPHRWDLAAMPAAGITAQRVYTAGITAILARHGVH